MMGRKTLGEIRAELEATLSRSEALRSGRGEVPESLRHFLGRESEQPAGQAVPDEIDGTTSTAGTTIAHKRSGRPEPDRTAPPLDRRRRSRCKFHGVA